MAMLHPDHCGRGIGTTLMAVMEVRATELLPIIPENGKRVVIINNIVASSTNSRELLERSGYLLRRVYFLMHIVLDTQPEAPIVWPQGITVRTCDGGLADIGCAYETIEEGFEDHWAHTRREFDDWQQHMVREKFDPTLWFFAMAGDQVAGAALCRTREEGRVWITQLTIRRPWRKRGVGTALLHHIFATCYQRNISQVGLGVDGQSLTGAQRLYEQVGMQTTMQIGRYEKEARPGNDPANFQVSLMSLLCFVPRDG